MGIVLIMTLLLASVGCGSNTEVETTITPGPQLSAEPSAVMGHVVSVEAASIVAIKAFGVEDSEGVVWSFIAEGPLEFTPSHLREHQLLGLPVVVTYLETTDGLLAVSLVD